MNPVSLALAPNRWPDGITEGFTMCEGLLSEGLLSPPSESHCTKPKNAPLSVAQSVSRAADRRFVWCKRPPPTAKPTGKGGGLRPPTFSNGFCCFRIQNCNEMALELVCGADFWCNRHCRTRPVFLEGFWGQVWPKINQKPKTYSNSNSMGRVPSPCLELPAPVPGGRMSALAPCRPARPPRRGGPRAQANRGQ